MARVFHMLETAAALTQSRSLLMSPISSALLISQIKALPSSPTLANLSPSGENETDSTWPECSSIVSSERPLEASRIRIFPLSSQLASFFPSGENDIDLIASEWAFNHRIE